MYYCGAIITRLIRILILFLLKYYFLFLKSTYKYETMISYSSHVSLSLSDCLIVLTITRVCFNNTLSSSLYLSFEVILKKNHENDDDSKNDDDLYLGHIYHVMTIVLSSYYHSLNDLCCLFYRDLYLC